MPTIKRLQREKPRVTTNRKREYQDIYQDRRWKILRDLKIKNNPLCELHEFRGKIVPADQVHHKIPFETGRSKYESEELAFDYDNLESLCESCHKERHKELKC